MRNLGIMAHIDAGKTTTTERMLYYAAFTRSMGDVDAGDTVTDYMAQERERGITIKAAAVTFSWHGFTYNLIDTPGHVDFTIEVERSARVLDGAVVVLDGVNGVEAQTETVWRQAERYNVPVIVFVNKLDREGASLELAVEGLRGKLNARPLVAQLPVHEAEQLTGVVDLVHLRLLRWTDALGNELVSVPLWDWAARAPAATAAADAWYSAGGLARALAARERLCEAAAEADERALELYVADASIPPPELSEALRRAVIARSGTVVLCGSALRNRGIQPLMDAVADYLPSPLDRPPVRLRPLRDKGNAAVVRRPDRNEPLCALAFKVTHDAARKPVVFVRVYSGVLSSKQTLQNATQRLRERPARLLRILASESEEVAQLSAGEIGALVGMRGTKTGDTLLGHADPAPGLLDGLSVPTPVFTCAVEAESSAAQGPLERALDMLALEDPSFSMQHDQQTGQTLLSGMGELHLDVLHKRLLHDFGVPCALGRMRIAYRETVTQQRAQQLSLERDVGGRRLVATVDVAVAPAERGSGNGVVIDARAAREASAELGQSAAASGDVQTMLRSVVERFCERGPLAGQPLADVEARVVSAELAPEGAPLSGGAQALLQEAVTQALRAATAAAQPAFLEPRMLVHVTTSVANMGPVMADLTSERRGVVRGIDDSAPRTRVAYASALRSITQGAASFTMEPAGYIQVPRAREALVLESIRGL